MHTQRALVIVAVLALPGVAVGAAVGAVAGVAAAKASPGNQVAVAAGTALEFRLAVPLSVDVVG